MGRKSKKKLELSYVTIKKKGGQRFPYWKKKYKLKQHLFKADLTASDKGYGEALKAWNKKKEQIDREAQRNDKTSEEWFEEEIVNLTLLAKCHHEDENFDDEADCSSRIAALRNMLLNERDRGITVHLGGGGTGNYDGVEAGDYGLIDYAVYPREWKKFGDRIAKFKVSNPHNQFITHHIRTFLDGKIAEDISPNRYRSLKNALGYFTKWFGDTRLVSEISGEELQRFRVDLLNGKITKGGNSSYTMRDILEGTKQWIRWMDELDIINAPKAVRNNSKSLCIEIDDTNRVVKTFANEEIRTFFDNTKERNKLYFLLMMNTSMTQKDIADLKKSEFNIEKRTIRRKRSKTRKKINVPTIEFVLWDETFNLLMKYRNKNDEEERVLLNKNGNPIVHNRIKEDGKTAFTDSVNTMWYRLQHNLNIDKEITAFRNSGATRIKNEFGNELSRLWLGQAKMGIAEIHYHGEDNKENIEQKQLNNAVRWLHTSYEIEKLTL